MKNKKTIRKITAVILSAFILIFSAGTAIRKKGVASYQENRKLAEIPEVSIKAIADGSYFEALGNYFTDQFAGRSYWVSFKGKVDAEAGEGIVNGVYVSDNMLLDTYSVGISEPDAAASIFNEYESSYNGAAYFVAVPTSSAIYSDTLPEYFTFADTEKESIDNLYSELSSGIRTIDAYNILKMFNSNYIYYRNDSRWTSYGAYCVYRTVIQKLGFIPTAYDKYTIRHITGNFRGSLYNRSQYTGVKADIIDAYDYEGGADIISCTGYDNNLLGFEKELYDEAFIDSNDMYKYYLGEDVPLVVIKTSVNNDRKLLVIKNDYADCFIPFLIQHYSEIAVISLENLNEGMSKYIDANDYEQTLFLFGMDQFPTIESLNLINK